MLKQVLLFLICTQMTLASAHPVSQPIEPMQDFVSAAAATDNSLWDDFTKLNPTGLDIPFSKDDPALDQDPFFLRSQTWKLAGHPSTESDFGFSNTPEGIDLQISQGLPVLSLNLPFEMVAATDDFVFFSLRKSSPWFTRVAAGDGPSEGLFFISREDLIERALASQPVPVYFMPLPGRGWTGSLRSHEIPEAGLLSVAGSDSAVSLELQDIENVMKAERINLLLAAAWTTQAHRPNFASAEGGPLFPAAGLTAGFGMFFTGVDLASPQSSFWAEQPNFQSKPAESFQAAIFKAFDKFPILAALAPRPAQALELGPAVIHRLVYVGSVLTAMMALSVVLKYAHPGIRQKLINNRDPGLRLSKAEVLKREARETLDVFAHVTTTVTQFPSVTLGNGLELFLDALGPATATTEHGMIRRIMKNTFYFVRDSQKSAPVNAKTFILGALVMGNVDTAAIALQYMVVIPWMMTAAAPYLNAHWQHTIQSVLDPANPNTKNLVIQEPIRAELYYLLNGASDFSMTSQSQALDPIQKEVDAGMLARGMNPQDPSQQAERQKRIDEKMTVALKQRGLPGKDQFLFDANSLFQKVPRSLGYQAPAELEAKESFILARRFTLSQRALRRALQLAKAHQIEAPSAETAQMVDLLQETLDGMSFLVNGIGQGRAGLEKARQVRTQLTLLSYEGPVDAAVRYIPESWKSKYSPEVAQAASLLFRQSLYSFLMKEGKALIQPEVANVTRFGIQARTNVIQQMQTERGPVAKITDADPEFRIRLQLEIARLTRDEAERLKNLEGGVTRGDSLERRQHARAERFANDQMAKHAGPEQNESQRQVQWKKDYRIQMAREVGLHFTPQDTESAFFQAVEAKAEADTQVIMRNDPSLALTLQRASVYESQKIEASVFAIQFLFAYKQAATEEQLIPSTDPRQPGRFQKFRQSQWGLRSPTLTRLARFGESFFDDQALKPGWMGYFGRNVPLFEDLWAGHRRLVKTILPSLTVSYLWSYYAWQVHLPFSTWALILAMSGASLSAPVTWLNRAFRTQGLKANDGVMSKVIYAVPLSWVTFFGMIPTMLLGPDLNRMYTDSVREPIASVLGQIPTSSWLEAATAAGLLVAVQSPSLKENAKRLKKSLLATVGPVKVLRCETIFLL